MEKEKQTSIQIKIDKSVSKQLKNRARQKDMIYSAYVRKLIVDSLEKEKDQEGNSQK